ncbi:MAG: hypothetical protein ACK4VO_06825 [Pseudobdellovibrio sp.]
MSRFVLTIIIIFIKFTSHANVLSSQDISYRFQRDLYIVKNNCGDIYMSYPQALRIEVKLPSDFIQKDIKINFNEGNSKFSQNIIYNRKTFFYPGIFSSNGHHEYELPDCNKNEPICEFGFFVFISGPTVSIKKWNVSISMTQIKNENKNLIISNQEINNEFSQKPDNYLFTNIDFKRIEQKNLNIAYLDPQKVKNLIDENFDVEFVFSWRNSIEQIEYSEEFHNISSESTWLSKNSFEFPMTKKIKSPTYLSFMIHARKGPLAYESKIVIIDKKQDFFNQCRK